MATSDNVVRAGLTPKPKDVPTLVSMLTYNTYTSLDIVMNGERWEAASTKTKIYRAPVPEFSVLMTKLAHQGDSEHMRPIRGPSILICVQGNGSIGMNKT
jgi:mannose-6-phosphate isomerase